MMSCRTALVVAAGLSVLQMVGCATVEPTLGDRMLSQGEGTRELGQRWNDGQDSVARGEALRKKGTEQVEDGNNNLTKGDRLVIEGRRLMRESEAEFRARPAGTQ